MQSQLLMHFNCSVERKWFVGCCHSGFLLAQKIANVANRSFRIVHFDHKVNTILNEIESNRAKIKVCALLRLSTSFWAGGGGPGSGRFSKHFSTAGAVDGWPAHCCCGGDWSCFLWKLLIKVDLETFIFIGRIYLAVMFCSIKHLPKNAKNVKNRQQKRVTSPYLIFTKNGKYVCHELNTRHLEAKFCHNRSAWRLIYRLPFPHQRDEEGVNS